MATSVNITYGKLYTIGKSKLCWFQMCANGVGRQSGRKDMSKTKVALNPRLRLQIFRVTVKRPSKVGQRKVRSLVRNRNWKAIFILCLMRVFPWHRIMVGKFYTQNTPIFLLIFKQWMSGFVLNFDVLVMFLCPFIPFDFIYGLCSTQGLCSTFSRVHSFSS